MSISGCNSYTPFMILSTGRCGSTLLGSMLNNHPNIAVPPESFFWNTFTDLMHYYGDLKIQANLFRFVDDVLSTPHIRMWTPNLTRDQILGRLQNTTACGVFNVLMSSWASSNNKYMWGDQTPQNVFIGMK